MSILARAYLVSRDYAAAEAWALKAIQRVPDQERGARAYLMLASTLGHLDRLDEARDVLEACRRIHPRFADDWKNWQEYKSAADNQHILDGLRKAGLPE